MIDDGKKGLEEWGEGNEDGVASDDDIISGEDEKNDGKS